MTEDIPRGRAESAPSDPKHTTDPNKAGWTMTRMIAVLFLIPSVPMLIGSVAALAMFYVAPVRFGGLIARLPADDFIRTVLFFAPATLFALVVLAFLYAREPAPVGAERARAGPARAAESNLAQSFARWSLGLLIPGFLLTLLVLLFSLVAPGRFTNLVEPLPGDRFLRPLVPIAPLVLLGLGLVTMRLAFARAPRPVSDGEPAGPARTTRTAVGLILVSSVSMLGLSLAALGVSYVRPDRFQQLMSRLEPETFLRLALLFAPATLTAVVILALLYLTGRAAVGPAATRMPTGPGLATAGARSTLAVSVLVGGLLLSTIVALGLLAVLLVLLVR